MSEEDVVGSITPDATPNPQPPAVRLEAMVQILSHVSAALTNQVLSLTQLNSDVSGIINECNATLTGINPNKDGETNDDED